MKTVNSFLSLQAFLGCCGVKTSRLMTNQDYWTVARTLFPARIDQFEGATLEDLHAQVKAMTKAERRFLGRENIKHIPAKLVSVAPVHQAKLQGAGL